MPEPLSVSDYEQLAIERMDSGTLAYFQGGAADERTLVDNVAAWARHRLLPRVLVDVSRVSTGTTVLGTDVSLPVLIAPVALQKLAVPEGESAMARAAASAGTIMTLSTLATSRPSEIARAAPDSPQWLQIYVLKDRGVTQALIDEAVDSGFQALVLTVDAPTAGRRERDLRAGFAVPPELDMPAVTAAIGRSTGITPAGFFELMDRTLRWHDVEALVAATPLPLLIKGIQHPDDARRAVASGVAGIIVSNHGGRQLDNVPATADALGPVAAAVDGAVELLVDGGIRRGTDVIAALALGARAVLVGRAALYGLVVGGEAGARHVLELLRAEIEIALTLLGAPTPGDVGARHLAP